MSVIPEQAESIIAFSVAINSLIKPSLFFKNWKSPTTPSEIMNGLYITLGKRILFTNNLPNIIKPSRVLMYADDVKIIYISSDSDSQAPPILRRTLTILTICAILTYCSSVLTNLSIWWLFTLPMRSIHRTKSIMCKLIN